jgi:signal transduction histidine kinase
VEARAGISVEEDLGFVGAAPAVEEDLFCIATEALNNVVKHAHPQRVRVELKAPDGRVRLTVADDGRGFDPSAVSAGVGLRSMRERTERHGGAFAVESAPGAGTRVVVEIPASPPSGVGRGERHR